MTPTRIVLFVIAVGTLARLWLASVTGLGFDESYSLGNARYFSWSYVDHAPLHLWLAGLTAKLFASEASGIVRAPFILLFAGTTWLMYTLTRRLFGENAGLWAVGGLSIAPVFSLAHASWVLPDGPALFFMTAAANVIVRILFDEGDRRRTMWLWIAAGALGGLAILSKYNAVFIFVGTLLFVLTVPRARHHLATPGPWLGSALALIIFSPVIVWNLDNELVGYFFQSQRIETFVLGIRLLLQDVAGQALFLMPLLFVPLVMAVYRAFRDGPGDEKAWFIVLVAIGPIVVFSFFAIWSRSYPHWTMPGWLFVLPLFGRDSVVIAARRPRLAYGYMTLMVVSFAVVMSALVFQTLRGGLIPTEAGQVAPDPTLDLVDWRELKGALVERGLLEDDPIVAATFWMQAGKVSHALGPDIRVVCICHDPQHFRFRYDQTQWAGRDMVVVAPVGGGTEAMWRDAARFFDRLEPLEPVIVERGGKPALTLELRMGRNLQPPQQWYDWAAR